MAVEQRSDFFVSYVRADQAWAEWIAWQLEEAGYRATIQAWDFGAGTNFVKAIHNAISQAACTVAVISADYFKPGYAQSEWTSAFAEDPESSMRKLIPVRVGDCEVPGLMRSIVYIDLVDKDEATARSMLLQAIHSTRTKPDKPPQFPGSRKPLFPGSWLPGGPHDQGRENQAAKSIPNERRIQFALVLTGTIDQNDKPMAEALVQHFRKLAADANITLVRIEPGSVVLVLEGSEEGVRRLRRLYNSGRLRDLLGFPVVGIRLTSVDTRPPILFLRSFSSAVGGKGSETNWEQFAHRALGALGPLLTIGDPSSVVPALGATRMSYAADEWADAFMTLADASTYVVAPLTTSQHLRWELDRLRRQNYSAKILLLTTPQTRMSRLRQQLSKTWMWLLGRRGMPDSASREVWNSISSQLRDCGLYLPEYPGPGAIVTFNRDGLGSVIAHGLHKPSAYTDAILRWKVDSRGR